MKRFSRKRQSILEFLESTDTHPGAETIYERLRPVYPDLSLATVYRNLGQLKNDGKIISVGYANGEERFDGRTSPHTHAICSVCGKISDVDDIVLPDGITEKVSLTTGFKVTGSSLSFTGVCAECRNTASDTTVTN